MNYEKFPFGKYKGYLLSELPNTYIVYALETFDLPAELMHQMRSILLINLGIKPPKEIVAKVVISISEKLTKEYAVHGDAAVSAIDEFKFLVLDYLNL
jgi:uncharacterized protein (DUF3820 family)